jgi:activator of HSP90 ATPase
MEKLTAEIELPVTPEILYHDWLDSNSHSQFTGAAAQIAPEVGGAFTAWDGYISGTTIELESPRRILQQWRTTEFPSDSPDSILEILFIPTDLGTRLILNHSNIPDGQGDSYFTGWQDYYFEPMLEYYKQKGGKLPA